MTTPLSKNRSAKPDAGTLRLGGLVLVWIALAIISGFITPWAIMGVIILFPLGLMIGIGYGAGFLQALYAMPDYTSALQRMIDLLFGIFNQIDPINIVVKEGTLDKKHKVSATTLGGPSTLIVYEDSAVVLERDGKFSRIVGPSITVTHPLETVRTVIDLRRQVHKSVVQGFTRDGIPVRLEMELEFQIQPWALPPNQRDAAVPRIPYPFRERAVCQAAYQSIVVNNGIRTWNQTVVFLAECELRALIRQHVLDKLFDTEDSDPQKPLEWETSPRYALQNELHHNLSSSIHALGVTLLRVTLGPCEIDTAFVKEDIEKERIQVWQAEWKKRAKLLQKDADVEATRLKEIARAQAQADMVTAISNSLPADLDSAKAQHLVALRTLESLEAMALDPLSRRFIPEEIIATLQMFHRALQARAL